MVYWTLFVTPTHRKNMVIPMILSKSDLLEKFSRLDLLETAAGAKESVESTVSESLHSKRNRLKHCWNIQNILYA